MVGEFNTDFGANNHRRFPNKSTKPANVQISQGMCRNVLVFPHRKAAASVHIAFVKQEASESQTLSQSAMCGSAPLPITCSLNGTNIL